MNSIDERIANQIWPQYARPTTPIPYADKVQKAVAYLGDRHLLARPQKRGAYG